MDFIKLTSEKLGLEEIMNLVAAPNCGAISFFVGTTRDNFENKKVLTLEYEAYESMAEKALKEICVEMRNKWEDIENIAIYHRLGKVEVMESSVIIAVSSPHRKNSQEATQWCIDTLKKSAPIWKKEIYEEDEPQWKENTECQWSKFEVKNKYKQEMSSQSNIPSHLIQITCSNEELQRRIKTFMQRKREQVNNTNIRDFCGYADEEGCARVNAVLKRQKNSKSHLRMQRVYNSYGPYNIKKCKSNTTYISDAVEQRVESLENCLNIIKPVPRDVYERLKKIEDRILYLESISPEYAYFWNKEFMHFDTKTKQLEKTKDELPNKPKFDVQDIDNILYELEKQSQINQNK